LLLDEFSFSVFRGRFFVVDVALLASPDTEKVCSLGLFDKGSSLDAKHSDGVDSFEKNLRIDDCMAHSMPAWLGCVAVEYGFPVQFFIGIQQNAEFNKHTAGPLF
jgi:hypothetical protein